MKFEFEQVRQTLKNDLFRSAFDHSPIGMALVGMDGNCYEVNNAICRITGYSKKELVHRSFADITHPEDVEKDRSLARKLIHENDGSSFELEKRYIHKNGRIVWVLLTVSVIRDPLENPLLLLGQVQDITERRWIETKLNQRERELISVLNNTQTVIVRLDRDCRHLYINSAIEKEIGIPASEMIGKTFAELDLADDSTRKIEEAVRRVFKTGSSQQVEYHNRINKKNKYYLADFTPEFNDKNEVETVLAVSLNVTDLMESQQNLQEALSEIKVLREILPICSYCRNVRDDGDYWQTVENYLTNHKNTQFTHGICPSCYETVVKPHLAEHGIDSTGNPG
ncbi:MAG: PAS domain S-box protein [Acidobacteria bacterium]|nr:PAS domain S-box protein [Acidobacteriota bacterium]